MNVSVNIREWAEAVGFIKEAHKIAVEGEQTYTVELLEAALELMEVSSGEVESD